MNSIDLYKSLPKKITHLLDFFDSTPDIIAVCDVKFTIQYVNLAFEKLSGVKVKEALGTTFEIFDADAKIISLSEMEWKNLEKGISHVFIGNNKKLNGEQYHLQLSIIPVTEERYKGKITHLIFSGKNTTEKTKALNAVLASEKSFIEAQRIAEFGYYELDIQNDSWTASVELNRIFGINKNYKKSYSSWVQLIHPDYKEKLNAYFRNEVLAKKIKFNREYKIIDFSTGKEKWVHGFGEIVLDENQNPIKLIGTIQDITKKRTTQELLKNSEQNFRSLISSMNDGVIKVDNNETIQYVNNRFCQQLGYSEDELIGKKTFDLILFNKKDRTIIKQKQKERTKKEADVYEIALKNKNGDKRLFEVRASATYNAYGKVSGSIGINTDITEKKQIEDALKASEEKYRSIFHSLKNGAIIVINKSGIIIEWNKGAEEIFGHQSNEILGSKFDVLMPSRFRKKFFQGFKNTIKQKGLLFQRDAFDFYGLTRNGREFPVELTIGSWIKGKEIFFSAIILDTSNKQEALDGLNQANTIIQGVDSILLLTNAMGEVEFCSSAVKQQTGYDVEEVMGKKWWEVSFESKKESDLVKKKLIQYSKNNDPNESELHLRKLKCKDGSIKWFEWRNTLGVDNYIISNGHDVTSRILAEQEVTKLSLAINQSPVSFVITNLKGSIEYVNPHFEKVTGYSSDEVMGKNPRILNSGKVSNKIYVDLWKTISSGKTWKGEFLNVKKDGTLFWELALIGPVFNKEGVITNYFAIKEDITERKGFEKQLNFTLTNLESLVKARTHQLEIAKNKLEKNLNKEKELGDLKSRFVATASHQFRTPLTVIQANIGLLNMQLKTADVEVKEKLNKVCGRIQAEVDRMTELMNDVLIIGKINAGGLKVMLEPNDLVKITHGVVANYNNIQVDGRIVSIKIKGVTKKVNIDKNSIQHVISNLLSNALKYSENKPAPEVVLSFMEKEARVSIKDYGIGMTEADLQNIFTPFYRGTNVDAISGTGLGNSIAKEYAELNHGTIKVSSQLNEGSEFILTLQTI